ATRGARVKVRSLRAPPRSPNVYASAGVSRPTLRGARAISRRERFALSYGQVPFEEVIPDAFKTRAISRRAARGALPARLLARLLSEQRRRGGRGRHGRRFGRGREPDTLQAH